MKNTLKHGSTVGRSSEICELQELMYNAFQSHGNAVFISGEAGVGKTTLSKKIIEESITKEAAVFQGWCLSGDTTPLSPFREAFSDSPLSYLMSGKPPPFLLSTYLMEDSGMLVAKHEREVTDLDPDIFASMLKAVENFMGDSLSIMGKGEESGLNGISFGEYEILLKSWLGLTLAAVIKGEKNEFLIADMEETLRDVYDIVKDWNGEMSEGEEALPFIEGLIRSGKYEGYNLVEDPKIMQENLFDNVVLGLRRLSQENPVVIFLDDMQWADATTLSLLHYISRNIRDSPILILGTYRSEELYLSKGEGKTLRETLMGMNREGLYHNISLNRLDKEETRSLIETLLVRSDLSEDFYDKIYEMTTGNPLFIEELILLLVDEGKLIKDEVWILNGTLQEIHIPNKIYNVIQKRLDKLNEEQYNILECASAMGNSFKSDIIQEILEMNRFQFLKILNNIEKKHNMIQSGSGKYIFDHNEIRDVIYDGISDELKVEYHRMIGDCLEQKYIAGQTDLLTNTALQLYLAEDDRAVEYLIKGAESAADSYSNKEAIEMYDKAMDMLEEDDFNVLIKYGDLHLRIGENTRANEVYRQALEAADTDLDKIKVVGKIGHIMNREGEYGTTIELCTDRMDIVHGKKHPSTFKLFEIRGWAYLWKGDYENASEDFREALRFAEELESKDIISDIHHAFGTLYFTTGKYTDALENFKYALEVRRETGDELGMAKSLNNMGNTYQNMGDNEHAMELYRQSLDIMSKVGDKYYAAATLNNIGIIHWEKGELDKTLDTQKESLELFRKMGNQRNVSILLNNIGNIYHDRGELDNAMKNYSEALTIAERLDEKLSMIFPLSNIGKIFMDKGDLDKAEEYLKDGLALCREGKDQKQALANHIWLGELYLKRGEVEKAVCQAKSAKDITSKLDSDVREGISRTLQGMVYRNMENFSDAEKEFIQAIELIVKSGEKRELAKTYYEYSLLLFAMEEEDKEKKYADMALEIWEHSGMTFWIEKMKRKRVN